MTTLVTGGAGYLGGRLVESLLYEGREVVVVDKFMFLPKKEGFKEAFPEVKVIPRDYRGLRAEDLKWWNIDTIYHLAGMGSDPAAAIDVRETYDVNMMGAVNLSREAKKANVKHFVFISSCSVYGVGQGPGLSPGDACQPVSEYGVSKLAAEVLLEYEAQGLRIARLGTLAGPGHPATRTRFDLAINAMTLSAVKTRVIRVTGGGKQWRPMLDVRNAASALAGLTGHPEGTYNLAAYNVQALDVATEIAQALDDDVAIQIMDDVPDRRDYQVMPHSADYGPLYLAGDSAVDVRRGLASGEARVEPDTTEVWQKMLSRLSPHVAAVAAG